MEPEETFPDLRDKPETKECREERARIQPYRVEAWTPDQIYPHLRSVTPADFTNPAVVLLLRDDRGRYGVYDAAVLQRAPSHRCQQLVGVVDRATLEALDVSQGVPFPVLRAQPRS